MTIFTGFKFRTPAGYLTEREQDALIKHILARIAAQPATANEVRLVIEGRADARNLSASTLAALRDLAGDFVAAGKSLDDRSAVLARPRIRLVPTTGTRF